MFHSSDPILKCTCKKCKPISCNKFVHLESKNYLMTFWVFVTGHYSTSHTIFPRLVFSISFFQNSGLPLLTTEITLTTILLIIDESRNQTWEWRFEICRNWIYSLRVSESFLCLQDDNEILFYHFSYTSEISISKLFYSDDYFIDFHHWPLVSGQPCFIFNIHESNRERTYILVICYFAMPWISLSKVCWLDSWNHGDFD